MRIDLALTRLRFAKTRSVARALVEAGHLRVGGRRVRQSSQAIEAGDIITMPRGNGVLVIEILALPERRGPAAEAQSCYRVLDPAAQTAIAGDNGQDFKGKCTP